MIKKPAELKLKFRNGTLPDQDDFGDLIDSFLPREAISDQDLAALREMAVWWRSGGPGTALPGAPTVPPIPGATPASSLPVPDATPLPSQDGDASTPVPPLSLPASLIAADGSWAHLPVTTAQPGTWLCSVVTVQPRPGYRVSGNAIAAVDARGKRLVQCMERDSLLPWRSLQFAWFPIDGSDRHYLALRARMGFGADSTGADARILCTIQALDPHA